MVVFDTSAFINGWRYHYPRKTFPSVWEYFATCMGDRRVIAPRAVYVELGAKDDDVYEWAKARTSLFLAPSEAVQKLAGQLQALMPAPGVRDQADPWVIAEAKHRGFTVVTYEGTNSLTGARTKRWADKMPGICQREGVPCCIVPEALEILGFSM